MVEIDRSDSDFIGIEVSKAVADLPEDEMVDTLAKLFVEALQNAGHKFKESDKNKE